MARIRRNCLIHSYFQPIVICFQEWPGSCITQTNNISGVNCKAFKPTELASHYFHAELAHQFDEFVWFDHTQAVHPITTTEARRFPPEHPFYVQ